MPQALRFRSLGYRRPPIGRDAVWRMDRNDLVVVFPATDNHDRRNDYSIMVVEAIMNNVTGGQFDSFRGGNRRDVLLQRSLHQIPDAGSSHFSCMTCVYGVKSIALLKRELRC